MRISLKRHALLYSAAGAVFLAGTLQAGLVSTVNASGQFVDLSQSFGCSDAGTTTASCSFESQVDVYHRASGSYQANAQYGGLDVTSMSSVYGGYLSGRSTASLSDTFLLTGGIGSGTLVFVAEYWGYGQGESCDTGACLSNSTVALNTFTAHPYSGAPAAVDLPLSFSFGVLFSLNASASAYSSASGHATARQTAHLKLNAIEVRGSDGKLITDFAVTSGSGAAYPFVAPEPGTFALVIAALIVLPVIRRKSISAYRKG